MGTGNKREGLGGASEDDLRPGFRPNDPRSAAEAEADALKRAGEIFANFDGTEDGTDEFVAPAAPAGWTYEWKRKTVYNQEDPAYTIALRRTGWAEVPASRHPEMMPPGWKGNTIERKGCVLMERPKMVTERFQELDRTRARQQVRAKEEQAAAAPQNTFDRNNKDQSLVKISKGYEPMPIPEK